MSAIKEGDLVMVVRACCSRHTALGWVRTVRTIERCGPMRPTACCRYHADGSVCAHLDDEPYSYWVPLSWLKKLEGDPEDVHTEREVTAC